jgi:radical SAM protein with 4Fe4S-binding SPASM domain
MTTLRDVVARTWEENRLFSALVELTYRCNLDCFFCYNDLGLRGKPMTTPGLMRLFEDLASLQVMNLALSGGEPLAHPDFFVLGRKARELGFVVRVKSNGHALSGRLARRLRDEVDPYMVEVSLHGATTATHDRQTRVSGSFERLVANLREMRRLGLRLQLNATLTAWNSSEIEAMFGIADDLGARLQFDPEVTPRDDGDAEPLAIAPSREAIKRLYEVEFERGEKAAAGAQPEVGRQADEQLPTPPSKHCGAGSSGIAVDPFGNVYPCVQWRRPVGNLHEQSIREIWRGSPALEQIRAQTSEVKTLLEPEADSALLNFCPGLAAAHGGGDPRALYPGAVQRRELLREVSDERKRIPLRVLR